jgi:hypothetical protein
MTTLAAIGLWAALLTEVTFASLGIGLPAIPGTLRAMRRLENTVRRRTMDWCGVAIGVPYLPEPAALEERSTGRLLATIPVDDTGELFAEHYGLGIYSVQLSCGTAWGHDGGWPGASKPSPTPARAAPARPSWSITTSR